MKKWFTGFWNENKAFFLFILLMFVFRSVFADWNVVPTGSMKPTILEGDRILVDRMAYDIRLPFTHISLYKVADPARGDIIIFDSSAADEKLVKRVIGIPGDVVELKNNVLFINGRRLSYRYVSSTTSTMDESENLLGVRHLIRVKKSGSELSSFAPVRVPPDFYLAMGDNRDRSADSRVIGFIPRSEIVGRSRHVIMSLNYDNYYLPRSGRFFHSL